MVVMVVVVAKVAVVVVVVRVGGEWDGGAQRPKRDRVRRRG